VDTSGNRQRKTSSTQLQGAEGVEACIRAGTGSYRPTTAIIPFKQSGQIGDNSSNGNGTQPPIAAVSLVDHRHFNRYEQESLQVNA